MIKVDLHSHSTCSDGSFKPEEVVGIAKRVGVSIMSLTDHDTTCGVEMAMNEGNKLGVKVIPGLEVTAKADFLEDDAEFHILGYYVDIKSKAISELQSFSQSSRHVRNQKLIEGLKFKGYMINYDKLVSIYGNNFGRPNIVSFMKNKGYIESRSEGYRIIKALNIKRAKLDYRDVISLIKQSNGIAVVAHPITLKLNYMDLYCFLKRAKSEGLSGIEVFHSDHRPCDVRAFMEMAKELNLFFTAGSDFHGANKPLIKLGSLNISASDVRFPLPKLQGMELDHR